MGNTVIIGIAAALVLIFITVKSKQEFLINFILRAVLGTLGLLVLNSLAGKAGLDWQVGIGPFAVLTSGILGFPGLLLLYGIRICSLL